MNPKNDKGISNFLTYSWVLLHHFSYTFKDVKNELSETPISTFYLILLKPFRKDIRFQNTYNVTSSILFNQLIIIIQGSRLKSFKCYVYFTHWIFTRFHIKIYEWRQDVSLIYVPKKNAFVFIIRTMIKISILSEIRWLKTFSLRNGEYVTNTS